MIIDSHYNYIIIDAFKCLYKYEGKKSISIETLKLLRSELLKEIIDIYKNGKGHIYFQEIDKWQGEISFIEVDDDIALAKFLEKYSAYFYLKDGIVYLFNEVSFEDIKDLEKDILINEKIPHRFEIMEDTKKLRDILGINSIEKTIKKYIKIEEIIENLYNKLFTVEDNLELRKKIKSFLFLRYCFLGQVAKMPSYRIDAFKNIANYIYDEFDTSETYDKYPIDLNLWKAKYEDPDDFLSDIDPVVYDLTQYAIFGKTYNVLYFKKVCEDLEDLYLNETGWISDTTTNTTNNTTTDSIFDEENMDDIDFELLEREGTNEDSDEYSASFAYFYDSSNEFWVLYLNYLNNLNHFMDLYGKSEELLLAKKRLLYAIDKPNVMLFDENNFKNALEDAKDIELDEDPFDFFCDEVKCLSEEAFVIPNDEYTIRKLIFVGTYYALTEDSEIKETVLKYQNDERFAFFYEIMINNCKGKIKECLPEDIKKLLKKKK